MTPAEIERIREITSRVDDDPSSLVFLFAFLGFVANPRANGEDMDPDAALRFALRAAEAATKPEEPFS